MRNNNFGKELEIKKDIGIKLDKYKDLLLFHLEDYLFKTKSKKLGTRIGKSILNLHELYDIPQISFNGQGCLYSNGKEGAYISPEFFGKCFIERFHDVYTALDTIYRPVIEKNMKHDISEEEDDNQFQHIDFVKTYNVLVALKRRNEDLSKGLIGLREYFNTPDTITNLRKLIFASQVQKDIEAAIEKFKTEQLEEETWEYDNDDLYQSQEYKKLYEEHSRLFRNGPFIEAMEVKEWETKGRTYDEGTDEERDNWRKEYEELKEKFNKSSLESIKNEISTRSYPLSLIQKVVIDYLKIKMLKYDYRLNQSDPSNPYINELGLDDYSYYMHPADKHNRDRINRNLFGDESDIEPEDYDMFYKEDATDNYDEFDEGYSNKKFYK